MINKYLQFIKESFKNSDQILEILLSMTEGVKITDSVFDGRLVIFDSNSNHLDKFEISSANSRLKDIGYEILICGRDYHDGNWRILIIESEFFNELKSKGIIFYKDLKWEDWQMSKVMNVKTKRSIIKLDNQVEISILHGKLTEFDQITKYEISYVLDDDHVSVYNSCSLSIIMIEYQLRNKNA